LNTWEGSQQRSDLLRRWSRLPNINAHETAQSAMMANKRISDGTDDADALCTKRCVQNLTEINHVRCPGIVGHIAHAMIGDNADNGAAGDQLSYPRINVRHER